MLTSFFIGSETGRQVNAGVRHLVWVVLSNDSLLSASRVANCQDANLVAFCCSKVAEDPVNVYIPHRRRPPMMLFRQEEITYDAHVRGDKL